MAKLTQLYTAKVDDKGRVVLRGEKGIDMEVSGFSDGTYLLTPAEPAAEESQEEQGKEGVE